MKTQSNIKTTASLITTAVLLALPGHAAQNFSKTHTFTTGDSNFGATASFNASDNFIAPSGTILGSYSVTAGGTVTGKILKKQVTALSGTGTVKVMSSGTGAFSGNLKALGITLFTVSNKPLPYHSPHFIKKFSASQSFPFSIAFIPFNVTGKVTASVDAHFRVDTSSTTTVGGGIPRVAMNIGPVADLAATAEASVGVGISGLASLSAGASGSLRLGKAALTANATVFPTFPLLTSTFNTTLLTSTSLRAGATSAIFGKPGASATVSLTASTSGINGKIDLFAQAELFLIGTKRVTKTIASYSSGSSSVNLLGPVTYKWF